MTTPTCPQCSQVIPSDDINVANDIAYCRACNLSHALSALTQRAELEAGVDFRRPPAGTWLRNDGGGMVVGATHRSIAAALGLLAVALFWNGIVSVFVLVATSATLSHLQIGVPHWFPAPIMNESPMSVGMTLFLWIFLTPFIAIGAAMILGFLSAVAGHTEVRIGSPEGVVFSGIGSLGYSRRFDVRTVKDVRIDERQWRDSDGDRQRKTNIVIETQEGKRIRLGTMLTEERRKFVAAAVRKAAIR